MAVSHSARYQYAIRAGGAAARPCLPLKSRVVLKLADTARPYLQNIHVVSRAYVLLTLLSVLSHAVKRSCRLLQERVEWTKCVFAASAEAVEAENLFFVLGGPTSYMYT